MRWASLKALGISPKPMVVAVADHVEGVEQAHVLARAIGADAA